MSNHHDQRGGDRYAPPPRLRDPPLSSSRPPPSGPSRQFSGPPPPSSAGPPRHPSSGYSRPYDSAPRGPRYQDSGPPYPRHEAPPPPRRPGLSLWSTQNPGGRDGYHHSGQPPSQSRSYAPPPSYRDYDRDMYDRDRDYRGPPRDRYTSFVFETKFADIETDHHHLEIQGSHIHQLAHNAIHLVILLHTTVIIKRHLPRLQVHDMDIRFTPLHDTLQASLKFEVEK